MQIRMELHGPRQPAVPLGCHHGEPAPLQCFCKPGKFPRGQHVGCLPLRQPWMAQEAHVAASKASRMFLAPMISIPCAREAPRFFKL